ncbi:hypothetical protein GCM10009602_33520 [Nocardiopsis tropica]
MVAHLADGLHLHLTHGTKGTHGTVGTHASPERGRSGRLRKRAHRRPGPGPRPPLTARRRACRAKAQMVPTSADRPPEWNVSKTGLTVKALMEALDGAVHGLVAAPGDSARSCGRSRR